MFSQQIKSLMNQNNKKQQSFMEIAQSDLNSELEQFMKKSKSKQQQKRAEKESIRYQQKESSNLVKQMKNQNNSHLSVQMKKISHMKLQKLEELQRLQDQLAQQQLLENQLSLGLDLEINLDNQKYEQVLESGHNLSEIEDDTLEVNSSFSDIFLNNNKNFHYFGIENQSNSNSECNVYEAKRKESLNSTTLDIQECQHLKKRMFSELEDNINLYNKINNEYPVEAPSKNYNNWLNSFYGNLNENNNEEYNVNKKIHL